MIIRIFDVASIQIKNERRLRKQQEWFRTDYIKFKRMLGESHEFPISDNYACLNDKFDNSGVAGGAYFHQD